MVSVAWCLAIFLPSSGENHVRLVYTRWVLGRKDGVLGHMVRTCGRILVVKNGDQRECLQHGHYSVEGHGSLEWRNEAEMWTERNSHRVRPR